MVAPAMLDHSTLDLAAELADPELTPAAAATWHELQVRFQQSLDQMDEQDREVVLLRHFEHLSNGEVGRSAGPERTGRRNAISASDAAAADDVARTDVAGGMTNVEARMSKE